MLFRKLLISLVILLSSISAGYAENFNVEFVGATEGPTDAVAVSADGNTAYIGAGAYLCVLDVSHKNDPVLLGKVYTPGVVSDIAVVDDYAYVTFWGFGLRVMNVSDPSEPYLAGNYDTSGSNWVTGATAYRQRLDVSVVGDLVYVADSSDGLCILRFTGGKTTSVQPEGKLPITWGKLRFTALLQNYPNPFNPDTWIPFDLADQAEVSIAIYDVIGSLIRTFELGNLSAGSYISKDRAVHWDGKNDAGEKVSSGVYFYTLQAGDYSATKRMLILK